MSSVTAIHRDGVALELELMQVDALKASLRGTLQRSGDDGYADARSIWNGGGILPAPISCNCLSLQRKDVKASHVFDTRNESSKGFSMKRSIISSTHK